MIPKVLANFETSLATKISASASSLTLMTGVDDNDDALAGVYYLTVDEGTNSEEHMIVTLTGSAGVIDVGGISRTDGKTSVPANRFAHDRGASVKLTNIALIRVVNRLNGDEAFDDVEFTGVKSIDGLDTPLASEDTKVANVKYVNDALVAGATDATKTSKGIVEIATESEINADTQIGDTGAFLVTDPETLAASKYGLQLPSADEKAGLAGTSGTPSATNKYVTNDDTAEAATASKLVRASAGGKIDEGYLQTTDENIAELVGGGISDLHEHADSWVEQRIFSNIAGNFPAFASDEKINPDYCVSSDGTRIYVGAHHSDTNDFFIYSYKRSATGKYFYEKVVTVSSNAYNEPGITQYDGKIYATYVDTGTGVLTCVRYDEDLTNATSITVSGASNDERHKLTNIGSTFYIGVNDIPKIASFDLSGTTLTKITESAIITGAFSDTNELISLSNDGTNLVFSWKGTSGVIYQFSDLVSGTQAFEKVSTAGGAATEISSSIFNKTLYPIGIVPYSGDTWLLLSLDTEATSDKFWQLLNIQKVDKTEIGL